jgi:hypothetical protein
MDYHAFYPSRWACELVHQNSVSEFPQVYKELINTRKNPFFYEFEVEQWSKGIVLRRFQRLEASEIKECLEKMISVGFRLSSQIPITMWWGILGFLNVEELLSLRMVCRDWFKITTTPKFWQGMNTIRLEMSMFTDKCTEKTLPLEKRFYMAKWTKEWLDISQIKNLILLDDLQDDLKTDAFKNLSDSLGSFVPHITFTSEMPIKISPKICKELLLCLPEFNTFSFYPSIHNWKQLPHLKNIRNLTDFRRSPENRMLFHDIEAIIESKRGKVLFMNRELPGYMFFIHELVRSLPIELEEFAQLDLNSDDDDEDDE